MKLAYSTLSCPDWELPKIVREAKLNGYEGVELRGYKRQHISTDFSAAERKEVRDLFAYNNLSICCLTAYTRFNYSDEAKRKENIETLKNMIKLAADIGAPFVRTFGADKENSYDLEQVIAWIAEAFTEVDEVASACNVKVLLETHDVLSTGKDIIKIAGKTQARNWGVLWDVAHSIRAGEGIAETIKYLKDYIYHIHLKDWLTRPGKEDHYVLLGAGELPLEKIILALKEIKYDGYLSLEWEKTWHPEIEEADVAIYQYATKMKEVLKRLKTRR